MDGLLVIDKPAGLTSREALDRAGCWFPDGTRLGHTGTLDPLATGVLVLCVGKATRLAEFVQDMTKTYRAGILLGADSDTDDATGTVNPAPGATIPNRDTLELALASFVGLIEQVPPAYSAAKVRGRRAYALARRGAAVELAPRAIRIDKIDILSYHYPHLDLMVQCGKGTYLRSLARDLGTHLGCGGLIEALRRTRVGPFHDVDGSTLEANRDMALARLRPMADAVSELPRVDLADALAVRVRHGQHIDVAPEITDGTVAVFDDKGELAAIAEVKSNVLHAFKVF